jgi:tRNA-(ms[2]io[6]A)-hydroxylase
MDLALRKTDPGWLDVALSDLDATLSDHFHCERKAASSALALVRYYSQDGELVQKLAALAHEETRHMLQVTAQLHDRGVVLGRDLGDRYAAALRAEVRHGEPHRKMDLLLVSGLIEARSAERLALLGTALKEPRLQRMYHSLAEAEDRHRDLFLGLARRSVKPAVLEKRLAALVAIEGDVVGTLPLEPRIH